MAIWPHLAGLSKRHSRQWHAGMQAEDVLAAIVAWLQTLPANLWEHEADGSIPSPPPEKGRACPSRTESQSPINKLSLILTGMWPTACWVSPILPQNDA